MQHDLRPPGQPPASAAATSTQGSDDSKRMQGLYRMVWVLFGLVLVLTVAVLVILPSMVSVPNSDKQATVAEPAKTNQPAPLAIGVVRHDAEQALQDFLRLRAQPDLSGVELWAAEDWQQAMATAAGGDDYFGHGKFELALSAYQDATKQLQALLDGRPQRLAETLASGWQALENNNVDSAVSAFEQVLAMQPDHEDGRLGLARARARNQVMQLMQQGDQAQAQSAQTQTAENLTTAANAYTAALQLDPDYLPAQVALQQVKAELVGLAFQEAMSTALQSLDDGQLGQAEEALNAAAQISPDDPAVQDTRRRLISAQRQSALNGLRRQAAQHVNNENWLAAAESYRKALSIDSHAIYARSGLATAQRRIKLHAQLDHYLADTTRLSSDEPLDNARKLLQSNQALPANEPVLARKIDALQKVVRLAVVPVELLIQSDNMTEVAVYHVGRLGKFQQKQLTLRPGRYTVTGQCPGYRDVRKVITLRPDSGTYSLYIRCEEAI